MSKKNKYDELWMDQANRFAAMSHCERLQVGSVIVKGNNMIAHGWNGMPSGMDNRCEISYPDNTTSTKSEVIHAEANAILKLAKSTESSEGATLYVTHAPCVECAKMIVQSGIKHVVYKDVYRSDAGITLLQSVSIKVERLEEK